MPDALLNLLGIGSAFAAVLVLRRAWKREAIGVAQAGTILGGWALAALSLALLAYAGGFDRGMTIGVCLIGLLAYGLIGMSVELRSPKKARGPASPADPLDPQARPMRWARASLRCFTAVVLAATASIALGAAWSLHGPGSAIDRVVGAAFALPVVWGAATTWSLSDEQLSRPVIGLAVITALGALLARFGGAA